MAVKCTRLVSQTTQSSQLFVERAGVKSSFRRNSGVGVYVSVVGSVRKINAFCAAKMCSMLRAQAFFSSRHVEANHGEGDANSARSGYRVLLLEAKLKHPSRFIVV